MRARLADSCQGAELGSRPSLAAFYPELPHFPYRPYKGSEKGSEQAARRRPRKRDFAHEVWLQVLFCIEILFRSQAGTIGKRRMQSQAGMYGKRRMQ